MSHQVPTHVIKKDNRKLIGKETRAINPIGTITQLHMQFHGF